MHLGHQGAVQALKLVQVLHLIRLVLEALLGHMTSQMGQYRYPFQLSLFKDTRHSLKEDRQRAWL